MIVVEGIDGSGKTTLADALGRKRGWPVLHWSTIDRVTVAQVLPYVLAGPIVIDRCHLTPLVYGTVLRGDDDWTPYDRWAMEGVLRARGCTTVLCRVPLMVAWQNVQSRPQLFRINRNQLAALHDMFVPLGDRTFDYRTMVPGDVVTDAKAASPGVLGSSSPRVWLVGDRRARPGPLELVPFYNEQQNGKLMSGTLLAWSMRRAGLEWEITALSNSVVYDSPVRLDRVHEELGRPQVVALGGAASSRLTGFGIEHRTVPHPQWWRRFRHRDRTGYAKALAMAARNAESQRNGRR